MNQKPLIFDIKRASTADGPGIRTAVFLKGCSLNCFWCHNPEGKHADAEMAFFAEKCISCGACHKVCPTPTSCTLCGTCTTYCPVQAKKRYGKYYTEDELLSILAADRDYYLATGGGVTFTGGECMLFPQFVATLSRKCQEHGISVAIDTAGNVPYTHFETVLPYVDLFLYDIKCLDPELHRRGTGSDNKQILSNLEQLQKAGKSILIRTPCVPGFNDNGEQEKIRDFCTMRSLPLEFLPYHAMGEDKKHALSAFCKSK